MDRGKKTDAILEFQAGKDDDDFVKEQDIPCEPSGPGFVVQEGKSFPKANHVSSWKKWMEMVDLAHQQFKRWMGKKGGFPKQFPHVKIWFII